MTMSSRPILDPDAYLADCFRLARKIWDDGYRPDFLIALWRGGATPGIAIQEYFRWRGHDPYHTAIRTQSLEVVRQGGGFDIKGLEHVADEICAEHQLLIVDDLYQTGRTIFEVREHLRRRARLNMPVVRVATVYHRAAAENYDVGPHYTLHEVLERPVFPHQLTAMEQTQVRSADPELAAAIWD